MATLESLIVAKTTDEIRDQIYAALAARGVSTTSWKPGAVVRTIIAAFAVVLSAFSSLQALIARGGFLSLATGDWLTLLARYTYNVERSAGAFATGNVTLNNASGNLYTGGIGDLVVRNPATNKTYRNTASFTINPLQTGVTVPVQADEIGTASNAAIGTITAFVTPLLGVTCTNAAALVGLDAETDAALTERAGEKIGTLSPNGPKDAYAFVAKSALRTDGSAIGVTRTATLPDSLGNISVIIADADGPVSGPDVTRVTQLIQEQVEPNAVNAVATSATALPIAITYELWIRNTNTQTDGQVEDDVEAALVAFLGSRPVGGDVILPAGGKVYREQLEAVIGCAIPDTVRVQMTLPAADVSVAFFNVATLGTVTVTAIHRVPGVFA